MTRIATYPMNPEAVEQANMAVPVVSKPAERKAWMDAYIEAGGSHKDIEVKLPAADPQKQAKKLSLKNQNANKQASGPPGATKTTCNVTACPADALIVSEKDRSYKLELTRAKPAALPDNPGNIFQVISGWDEKSAVDISFLTKKCSRRAPLPCSVVRVKGGSVDKTIYPGSGKTKVYCQEPTEDWFEKIPLVYFIVHLLFPDKVKPEVYSVDTDGCSEHTPLHARIEAFPHIAWQGGTTLGFGAEIAGENDVKATFGLKGDLSVTYGSKKYSLEAGASDSTKGELGQRGLEGLLKKGFALIEGAAFLKKLDEYAAGRIHLPGADFRPKVTCTLTWPSISVSGKAENIEIKNKYSVTEEIGFTISVLFFGLEVKGDILDFIAAFYCPPLYRIKAAAQEGVKSKYGEIKAVIAMEISGEVSIKGELEYKSHGQNQNVTGSISAFGGFGLKGVIYVEGRVWRVYAGAGASASLMSQKGVTEKSGFTGTLKPLIYEEGKGFDWGGGIEFNGLAFYYAVYAYYGTRSLETDDSTKQKKRGNGLGEQEETDTGYDIKEKKEKMVKGADLLQPWAYPQEQKA